MKKIRQEMRIVYKERGLLGLIFSPIDYAINHFLRLLFSKKTILKINAVDVYQRYDSISRKVNNNDWNIIEIGGANTALQSFLSHQHSLTIVDIDKNYIPKKCVKYYCQRTNKLPFKNDEFDCLISVATLEHIHRKERVESISEWKRVAKKVIVYVPFGKAGKKYDQLLFSLRRMIGVPDKWTKEHITHGIPTLEELNIYFPNAKFSFIQNGNVWLITSFLTSIPVVGRILPGLIYVILNEWDKKEPFIGCVSVWNK